MGKVFGSRQWSSAKNLNVISLVFGIAPAVQLDLVARSSCLLPQEDEEFLVNVTKTLGARTLENALPMAAACRLTEGEAVALSIPIAEVEKASGRSKLFVTLVGVIQSNNVDSHVFAQLLAALDLAIAQVCNVQYQHPAATASALTRLLQHADNDRFRASLSQAINNISILFSKLPFDQSIDRRSKATGHHRVNFGATVNYYEEEPHFSLAELVVDQMQLTKRDQMGCYIQLGLPIGEINAQISAYRFNGRGVALCSPITLSDDWPR